MLLILLDGELNGIWNGPSVSYRNKIQFLCTSAEFSKQELIHILTFQGRSWYFMEIFPEIIALDIDQYD